MSECAWLVDMGYVVKAAKKSPMKLDYVIGKQLLSCRYGPAAVFLFNSYDPAYGIADGLRGFYHAMELQGMVVSLHPMSGESAAGNHRQRRVDVDFASHAVWQASLQNVKTLVLTTGDQDMAPMAKLCQERFKVKIVLFTFRSDVSQALADLTDERIFFEDHRDELDR